jgi:hypothetical protein
MSDLKGLLVRALAAQGALVEPIEPDGLEIVAPPELQRALAIPEWSRVGFGPEIPPQAVRVSFETDWAGQLERLLAERGRLARIFLQERTYSLPRQDLEKVVQREFVLQNATFRLGPFEAARAIYLLLVFYITASSDEKREDLVYLCINESNGALADGLTEPLFRHLRAQDYSESKLQDDSGPPGAWTARRIRTLSEKLLISRIRSQLSPFLAGMERRMARDLERLHVYYGDLRREAAERLAGRTRRGQSDDLEKADQMRLEAIEREYHAKVADLGRKYAMSVEIRFLQALHADMPIRRAGISILRRKGSRQIHLDWNPIARRLDHLICESCWNSPRAYCVCDDRLHLVCPSCLSPCGSCGKEFCRACHPAKCPRCSHPWKE